MIDDARLDEILAGIGADLAVSPGDGSAASRRHGMAAVAGVAALVVVAVGFLAIGPARDAVGGWWRFGRTELHADVDVALPAERLPAFVETASPLTPTAAAIELGAPLPELADTSLGEPAAWMAPDEGGVLAVWPDGATTLWLVSLDAGGAIWFDKVVGAAAQARELDGLGDRAVAVAGEHVLQTPLRRVTAMSTVLWLDGDVSYRLEADRPLDEVVALADEIADAS